MVETGSAQIVLGNHEFNAIAYATVDPTVARYLGGLRVVHACWNQKHIEHLASVAGPANTLTERLVIDGTTKGTLTHDAVEVVLKGPEVHLDGVSYADKDGHVRDHARLRWWDSTASTLRAAALIPPGTQLYDGNDQPIDGLPDRDLRDDEIQFYTGPEPVLFGHYWWRKEAAEAINPLATCLDYSVAKDGVLRAYRWDGETEIDETKFVDC